MPFISILLRIALITSFITAPIGHAAIEKKRLMVSENTRLYDIEIIFYEIVHSKYSDTENWKNDIVLKLDPKAISIFDDETGNPLTSQQLLDNINDEEQPTQENPIITFLSPNELTLTDDAKKLEQYHETKLILHTGWRQAFNNSKRTRIHFFGGMDYAEQFDESGFKRYKVDENTKPPSIQAHPWDVANVYDEVIDPTPLRLWQLDGFLDVSLSKYMHFDANFALRVPTTYMINAPTASSVSPSELTLLQEKKVIQERNHSPAGTYTFERVTEFKLQQSRKLKSHDLHIIDHPRIGILLTIRPSEEKEQTLENLLQLKK